VTTAESKQLKVREIRRGKDGHKYEDFPKQETRMRYRIRKREGRGQRAEGKRAEDEVLDEE
jgi:hypothetical protein